MKYSKTHSRTEMAQHHGLTAKQQQRMWQMKKRRDSLTKQHERADQIDSRRVFTHFSPFGTSWF